MTIDRKHYWLQQMGIQAWEHKNVTRIQSSATALASIDINSQWELLEARVKACTACDLYKTRTKAVFGSGNRQAKLMIIGEAPGASEDQQGIPFVGRAGQLLTAMLKAIGIERDQIYITNILKSRPPDNRNPEPQEIAACTPFLLRQLELVSPQLILSLGRTSAHFLLKTNASLKELRGQLFQYEYQQIPLLVSYHPAYLLRSPRDKRKAYDDLQLVGKTLAEW